MVTLSSLASVYANEKVLLTGHTGFKGAWLSLWLSELGAKVTGFALEPDVSAPLFQDFEVAKRTDHRVGDIRHVDALTALLRETKPAYIFHLAAQSLVRESYATPLETIETNILGTANLLEAVRRADIETTVVIVTSDKCYENREWTFGYREVDAMGGHDVYSMSKGAAELVTASYRRSFFAKGDKVRIASARAGNVIGGGDWAKDRIVPDVVRFLSKSEVIKVRNPKSVRPWQHVLEPLSGYLLLAARLRADAGLAEGWNFGPRPEATLPVSELVQGCIDHWGSGAWEDASDPNALHEAKLLRLSIEKAVSELQWSPKWTPNETIGHTIEWYQAKCEGAPAEKLSALAIEQINQYVSK